MEVPPTPSASNRTSNPEREARDAREARWLAEVAQGDAAGNEALQHLVEAYQVAFLRGLRRQGLSADDAVDAMQEVWVAVARKAGDYRSDRVAPAFWLLGFVNTQRDRSLRERHRQLQRNVVDNSENTGNDDDEEDGLVAEILKAKLGLSPLGPEPLHALGALQRCVQQALADFKRLHAGPAQLLYLFHAMDWTLDEVAQYRYAECRRSRCRRDDCPRTDCHSATVGAAKTYLAEARKAFRPLIEHCRRHLVG